MTLSKCRQTPATEILARRLGEACVARQKKNLLNTGESGLLNTTRYRYAEPVAFGTYRLVVQARVASFFKLSDFSQLAENVKRSGQAAKGVKLWYRRALNSGAIPNLGPRWSSRGSGFKNFLRVIGEVCSSLNFRFHSRHLAGLVRQSFLLGLRLRSPGSASCRF
jgi:hypothetical protein